MRPVNKKNLALWGMVGASLCLMVYATARNTAGHREADLKPQIPNGANLAGLRLRNTKGQEFVIPAEGKYLIAFLDTECGPCKRQVAPLNRAFEKGGYSGVLSVFSESQARVAEFESRVRPEFVCLVDTGDGPMTKNHISKFPQIVEVNNGIVSLSWVGYQERFQSMD